MVFVVVIVYCACGRVLMACVWQQRFLVVDEQYYFVPSAAGALTERVRTCCCGPLRHSQSGADAVTFFVVWLRILPWLVVVTVI